MYYLYRARHESTQIAVEKNEYDAEETLHPGYEYGHVGLSLHAPRTAHQILVEEDHGYGDSPVGQHHVDDFSHLEHSLRDRHLGSLREQHLAV